MKPLRSLLVALFLVFAFVLSGNSCGPFFSEAIFVQEAKPDIAYANYAKGRLGVPRPAYRVQDLVVAYDWLHGSPLTTTEQQQAVDLDRSRERDHDGNEDAPGMKAWLEARRNSGVPGAPPVPAKDSYAPPAIDVDRSVPGQDYSNYVNCLDDAFATAARTWQARKSAHAADTSVLADWITGQDAVFHNCGNDSATPAAAPGNAPAWLRQDRTYQSAAALFYQGDYDAAIAAFESIAKDSASPWHQTARLVVARALIRRATIGQITELPADARAPRAPYSKERQQEQEEFTKALLAKRAQRLTEAQKSLRAILADSQLASIHTNAAGLLDLVELRLNPNDQAKTLVQRLTAADRPQTPGVFAQAMIDLRFYLYPVYTEGDDSSHADRKLAALPLVDWIRTMQSGETTNQDDAATPKLSPEEGAAAALTRWRTTHDDSWLIAALSSAKTGTSSTELAKAASAIARTSPAWTAATYHRLRLASSTAETRSELDRLTPEIAHDGSRSAYNLFMMLRQRSAPTLDAFLKDAGTLPASISDGDTDSNLPDTKPNPDGLCGTTASQAETLLFDANTAAVLNTRMPLAMLADAAGSTILPRNLRFQIAQATWTRAVLLNHPEIALRMTPLLTGCYPAWKPWLADYDHAATPVDREATGLLALMRFASTEPTVRAGMQRDSGFATYSAYRDNWWTDSRPASKEMEGTLFSASMPSRTALPDPPFLTASDRTAAEREVAQLQKVPCASDYFAAAALRWQQAHPDDPRTPNILGFAERVVRSGCRTDATKELNHRLFVVVQTKYPKSEWARKYTTWE